MVSLSGHHPPAVLGHQGDDCSSASLRLARLSTRCRRPAKHQVGSLIAEARSARLVDLPAARRSKPRIPKSAPGAGGGPGGTAPRALGHRSVAPPRHIGPGYYQA